MSTRSSNSSLDYHPPPGTNTYGPFQKMTPLCYNVICGHNMGVQACMMMGFHSRLLAGSFWACIEHLAELKIAKMSVFPWCPERVAYDRVVPTTGRGSGIFAGLANRSIVVGFWWFWQFWKALEKVDEECHGFRALATSLNNGNSIWKMDFEGILGVPFGFHHFFISNQKNLAFWHCYKVEIRFFEPGSHHFFI